MAVWKRKKEYAQLNEDEPSSDVSSGSFFMIVMCAFFSPAGAHICAKMMSGIEKYLLQGLNINNTEYGELNSAASWAGLLLIPFAGGVFVDKHPTRYCLLTFTLVTLLGQLIFTLSVINQSFSGAIIGRAIFGVGECTVVVAQGTLCVRWFRRKDQLALAIGITEMGHNIANYVGKVSINIGLFWGDWRITLWFGIFVCAMSSAVTVGYYFIEAWAEGQDIPFATDLLATKSHTPFLRDIGGAKRLTVLFWMFCVVHFLVSNVEHLYDAVSTDFIHQKWGIQWSEAAWLSGLNYILPIFLSPIVGYFLDQSKNKMIIATMACFCMAAGHIILGFLYWDPQIGMLLLAAAESVLPTILRASVPLVSPSSLSGVTFGIYAAAENFGKLVGNPVIGFLKDLSGNYILDETILVAMSFAAVLCCVGIHIFDSWRGNLLKKASSHGMLLQLAAAKRKATTDSDKRERCIAMTPTSTQEIMKIDVRTGLNESKREVGSDDQGS